MSSSDLEAKHGYTTNEAQLMKEVTNVSEFKEHHVHGTVDPNRVEAEVTFKAYMMCAFASFGGIFYGYDSGYISGVMGMEYFIDTFDKSQRGKPKSEKDLPSSQKSLITSILSAGTFFGALMAGDLADWYGRRLTIIAGCVIFCIGDALQIASSGVPLLVVGRLISGFGVGFVSATIVLYMSEIAPRKVRGALVSGYQFCITIGLLIAACVNYGTQNLKTSASYRIPIGLQLIWAFILAAGLFFLPESPRYFVKKANIEKAREVLVRLRDQPVGSEQVEDELAEIVANNEIESKLIPQGSYLKTWTACFSGSIKHGSSNLRRTLLGIGLQMMQQMTGVNFIFYFGTTFFQQLGTIKNPFLISLITTLVNVCSTPVSFWTVERFGRRPILIWGAVGMAICEFVAAIIGTVKADDDNAMKAVISFICIYIFFFASTWGPCAWVTVGEVFPLPIRARGVALSTASNWFWNCIITVITPYMVGTDQGNLGAKVFFVWGSTCTGCIIFAYFLVPETKGLTLEQVDRLLEETHPRNSSKWRPNTTYAQEVGLVDDLKTGVDHRA
ncbi:uncharacterized protein KQ657_005188 [Scheffersomyces spartinae]|uniref:Major facilitator superfamily (MFS) profile domain-containing protein n=1 Tax=Scheffersomyces spartinae TaxID=45513 RepID=A0A9P7VAU0_9ASCO|nr:uncharacterized protein KQ657_005188 [Scheffersomyces spartinae]KAG7193989.1 hypothetical protein KQ657_005188 [Scheffersomyces spartinae]